MFRVHDFMNATRLFGIEFHRSIIFSFFIGFASDLAADAALLQPNLISPGRPPETG